MIKKMWEVHEYLKKHQFIQQAQWNYPKRNPRNPQYTILLYRCRCGEYAWKSSTAANRFYTWEDCDPSVFATVYSLLPNPMDKEFHTWLMLKANFTPNKTDMSDCIYSLYNLAARLARAKAMALEVRAGQPA